MVKTHDLLSILMDMWLKDQSPTQDHQLEQPAEHPTIMFEVLHCHDQVIIFIFDQENSILVRDTAQLLGKTEKGHLGTIKG